MYIYTNILTYINCTDFFLRKFRKEEKVVATLCIFINFGEVILIDRIVCLCVKHMYVGVHGCVHTFRVP